jgi:hypothetical protein
MRIFAGVMTLVFTFAAAVQWNDPDPLAWVAFYLALAASALGCALGREWLWLERAVALVAALAVLWLAPALADARREAVSSFRMKSPEDEVVRELGGAALGLAWTGALLASRRRARPSTPVSG